MTTLNDDQKNTLEQLLIALDEIPWPPLEKALSEAGMADPESAIIRLRAAVGLS